MERLIFNEKTLLPQCLGVIESVYWKSNEESVIGDRQKASTLEVKKPVSATSTSHTRADRVHGEFPHAMLFRHPEMQLKAQIAKSPAAAG